MSHQSKLSHYRGTTGHGADLGLWVEADSPAELMERAALALAELMFRGPRDGAIVWLPFEATGQDQTELLIALLAEVVYLADGEARLVAAVEIKALSQIELRAALGVIPLDMQVHRPGEPVKAVTYHQASFGPAHGRWRAEVVLDI